MNKFDSASFAFCLSDHFQCSLTHLICSSREVIQVLKRCDQLTQSVRQRGIHPLSQEPGGGATTKEQFTRGSTRACCSLGTYYEKPHFRCGVSRLFSATWLKMDGIILQGVLGFSQGAAMAAVLAAVVSSNVRERLPTHLSCDQLERPELYDPFMIDGKPIHPPLCAPIPPCATSR